MAKPGVFKTLNAQDIIVAPFKAYKSWKYATTSSVDSDGIDRLVAIKPNPSLYSGNKVTLDTEEVLFESASAFVNERNNKEASLMWYGAQHIFETSTINSTIYDEATIISIPQSKVGEGIKPGSVKLNYQIDIFSEVNLIDDGNGNLIDTALSSSISNEVLQLTFDHTTYDKIWANNSMNINKANDSFNLKVKSTNPEITAVSKNVWTTKADGLPAYPAYPNFGTSAHFYTGSYIRVSNNKSINFKRSQDYSISFWLYRGNLNTSPAYVLSKRTVGVGNTLKSDNRITTGDVNYNTGQYPFEILFEGTSNNITCRTSNGSNVTSLTGNFTAGSKKHVVLQKSGSIFQLYLDGVLIDSATIPAGNYHNNADLMLGALSIDSNGDGTSGIFGGIANFFIFSKALSQDEINQMSLNATSVIDMYNTNIVGKVLYSQGLIVISDPRPRYGGYNGYRIFGDVLYKSNTLVSDVNHLLSMYLEFNSTVTIYEHEFICKIKEDEFNFTSNPTIRLDNDESSEIPKDFVNGDFSPYITSVGLYSDKGELLAIGKLSNPIKKRDNVDLTIVVRFDA